MLNVEWATCLVTKFNGDEEYLPLPSAIRAKMDRRFRIDHIYPMQDEIGQWYVYVEATRLYDDEPYVWVGVSPNWHEAQESIVRWISGWWFEDDRY